MAAATGNLLNSCTFHPVTFLNTIKDLVKNITVMEGQAFATLSKSHLFTAGGHMLFRFFKEFKVDPQMLGDYSHVHDGTKCFHISYLEQV
ncbi:hypothetical protein PAXRUDRAFT_21944 [Paxillus rubicundulus Ve08.2h10]|uniref:Uncharacterized protein n=1 Tax=Paxillus rubicundulus Ve08.2h10 TaxID=930991 RepID=A0A0D0CAA2_9AGAM|nr:hypothetical protein PAXRUDRAFT_21944 [Paxillus rubicundulus Ve08.2h10]